MRSPGLKSMPFSGSGKSLEAGRNASDEQSGDVGPVPAQGRAAGCCGADKVAATLPVAWRLATGDFRQSYCSRGPRRLLESSKWLTDVVITACSHSCNEWAKARRPTIPLTMTYTPCTTVNLLGAGTLDRWDWRRRTPDILETKRRKLERIGEKYLERLYRFWGGVELADPETDSFAFQEDSGHESGRVNKWVGFYHGAMVPPILNRWEPDSAR